MRSSKKDSTPWHPERGLRERSLTFPALFNIFLPVIMRQAELDTRQQHPKTQTVGEEQQRDYDSKHLPVLFMNDTTIIANKEEIAAGVERMKETMKTFEEANNGDKDEALDFISQESNCTGMLGVEIGLEENVKRRIRWPNGSWFKVSKQLWNSKLSKKMKARIMEVCVKSTMLFDCHIRIWYKKDIKKMHSNIDRCYRRIWSNRRQAPLR